MNRSLVIPGVCLFILVASIYRGEKLKVDAAVDATDSSQSISTTTFVAAESPTVKAQKLDQKFKSLRDELLNGWPVLTKTSLISRAGPRQRLYVMLAVSGSNERSSSYFTLTNLTVVANGKYYEYPMMVDHVARKVQVFANSRWQDYALWKLNAINHFMAATGIKEFPKAVQSIEESENMGMIEMGMGMEIGEKRLKKPFMPPVGKIPKLSKSSF